MNVSKIKKDFLWYAIGSVIPIILNFIKTPIFTRYFSPTDYGYLTLINTTYSYINLFVFSWLLSCVWRYYLHERNNKKLNEFYANIIFLLFIGIIIVTLITLIWTILSSNILIKKLIIANYINSIMINVTTIYFIVIRLDEKAFIYNVFTIILSAMSFILLFILTFILKNSIDAMLNCNNIVNVFFLTYIIYKFKKHCKISSKYISKNLIIELTRYGFATVFFNMSILLLTSGDRYVINMFYSADKVGIYNQIYNLAQISIVAFIDIFFNIMNPYLIKLYEKDITNQEDFYKYIIPYVICVLPLTVYFSLYSKQIADLVLGEKFRVGYKMMPYIMISAFIYGLCDEHETRMKFKNKLKVISFNLITASVINMVLNFIFIPTLGYEAAALTTLISYFYLYLMDIKADTSNVRIVIIALKKRFQLIMSIFLVLFIQVLIHYLIKKLYFYYSISFSIIEGSIFLLTFYIYIYMKYKTLFKNNDSVSL